MFNNLFNYCFPPIDIDEDAQLTSTTRMVPFDTRIEMECKNFLPEVDETWSLIRQLSKDVVQFREISHAYKYEHSEDEQKRYLDQLKTIDGTIYNLAFAIHQRIQLAEKVVQPLLNEFRSSTLDEQESNNYVPAYIRIAENQLNSLKLSFKRIILKHNSNSIDYQNDLKRSFEVSRTTVDNIKTIVNQDEENLHRTLTVSDEQMQLQTTEHKPQQQQDLTKEEIEIADLQTRLESVRVLNERVRQMNEMTMALYLSVQEQNELADNIWLNTTTGSDYISQSVDEFRLINNLKQSKMALWIKLLCFTFCFLLMFLLILTLIIVLSQK
ncbi:unnamed protein product [Rotaria socialis]|uniref:t-SNARE coiled-coil homology domain-containing protein n=1 Tax=Rotaria socialis TaxID=392032 RepID=A0A818EZK7_9BILA|nr:unnamed protein product [Rotaria socialis]CAF3509168.1 unnamed protein product [Rotaria socialis]CAF4090808.1 unnamed protein product [Rotaria socialis]CAF4208085.1 unnamed protein product [Rotaria socialis]